MRGSIGGPTPDAGANAAAEHDRGALDGSPVATSTSIRADMVDALTRGAARAFAAGDTRAAIIALDAVRALVGDAAQGHGAAVLDLDSERRRRSER